MNERRPDPAEHAPYFSRYIDLVAETDVCSVLESDMAATERLLTSVGEDRGGFRYGPDKWSVKEVVGHLVDSENIFGYRARCIARGDTQSLPGFDENTYVSGADFDRWKLADLVDALVTARRSNLLLFRNLTSDAWDRRGLANDNPVSVRALAFTTAGHERHHVKILSERYGLA